jgi:halogenation protein CepH
MQGHKVLLLERDKFPRHQIGESLLPVTVHGICKLLGLHEELKNAGFVKKLGGSFRWGNKPDLWAFTFGSTWMLSHDSLNYAYQVRREVFDKILLDNARKHGVDVREEHSVAGTVNENGRVVGVRYAGPDGQTKVARARFVIDAGGHTSRVHEEVGERVFCKFFQNIALYSYWEGAKRLPPPNSGNVLSAAFDEGWFWFIPLSDTITSVGAVVDRDRHGATLKDGHEQAFMSFVERCPIVKDLLGPAKRITEGSLGVYRIRKDYSYCNTKFWAPGLLLVGDAGCFIDPVFSSGVHLATYSALLAARTVNTVLRGSSIEETECMDEFESRYRQEYRAFFDFLVGFYDMGQAQETYFWNARKVLGGESEQNLSAFARLVAGGATTADDFMRMSGMKREFFNDYIESRVKNEDPEDFFRRYSGKEFDAKAFTHDLRRGRSQVMAQALGGEERAPESVARVGGLVATRDGFHWARA